MPRNPRPSELAHTAGFIALAARRAEADVLQVLANLRDWSAGASNSSSGPSPKNQVSRPTEAQALGHDQWAQLRAKLVEHLQLADRAMREVERIRREVMDPPPERLPVERGLVRCANVHGCDAWAEKAGRCDTCYRYLRRTDRDRRTDATEESA
jgi:hypothetical protein